jgi:hypothetical protein
MSQDGFDTDRVVQLLLRDAIPTLGERARTEVRRLVDNYRELAREWVREGEASADAQRSFDRSVVDGLQQTGHDLFWDTTWPACPRHNNHPLWFDEDRDAWCCQRDGSAIAPLGELAALPPPAT